MRLRQGGNVWEKAGVNISVVYGSMPPEAYRAATGVKSEVKKAVSADGMPWMICQKCSWSWLRNSH